MTSFSAYSKLKVLYSKNRSFCVSTVDGTVNIVHVCDTVESLVNRLQVYD